MCIDRERHEKLEQLRREGHDAFPTVHLPTRVLAADVRATHDGGSLAPGEHGAWSYTVAGRIVRRRKHRHAMFLDLRDESAVVELCLKRERLDDASCAQLHRADIGDIVSAEGCVYVTDNHEVTLSITSARLLAKALRSPPARHPRSTKGDRRTLELLANESTRAIFKARSTLVHACRDWLARERFVEVEGPLLQQDVDTDDATAPVLTFAARTDRRVALRSSSRSCLRRCLVGGFERVYELTRTIAADRSSRLQAPERSLLTWAVAYADHVEMAGQAEQLILHAAGPLAPYLHATSHGQDIDLAAPWRKMTVREGITRCCELDILTADGSALAQHLASNDDEPDGWDSLVERLYRRFVEPTLIEPTIVFDFPLAGQVHTHRHPDDPRLASDFRIVLGGVEVARGDSELNDPREQRRRLDAVASAAASLGNAATPLEADVHILEYGLCPAASAQIQLDRLLMLLSGANSVREVLPFPFSIGRH
jgi:lysyl-tRNA synthetase class 2